MQPHPGDLQQVANGGSQLEVVHLVYGVTHWVLILLAAVVGVWLLGLILAMLAWGIWGIVWVFQRLMQATRPRQPDKPPKTTP